MILCHHKYENLNYWYSGVLGTLWTVWQVLRARPPACSHCLRAGLLTCLRAWLHACQYACPSVCLQALQTAGTSDCSPGSIAVFKPACPSGCSPGTSSHWWALHLPANDWLDGLLPCLTAASLIDRLLACQPAWLLADLSSCLTTRISVPGRVPPACRLACLPVCLCTTACLPECSSLRLPACLPSCLIDDLPTCVHPYLSTCPLLAYLSSCLPVCLPAMLHSVKSAAPVGLLAVHYNLYIQK